MWEQVAHLPPRPRSAGGARRARRTREHRRGVYSQSWQYDDPAARLAERLGASRRGAGRYSGIGGSVPPRARRPQVGRDVAAGDLDLALMRRGPRRWPRCDALKKAGERPQWSYKPAEKTDPSRWTWSSTPPRTPCPCRVRGLPDASLSSSNARRAHLGNGLEAHKACHSVAVMARMTGGAPAPQPARLVPGGAQRRGDLRDAERRQPAWWPIPYTKLIDVDHGRRHGGRTAAGLGREGRRAGSARGPAGLPAGLRLRRGPRPRGRPP